MNILVFANGVGAAEGFFAAFIVFTQVRKRPANVWLGLFVLACALLCTQEAINRSDWPLAYPACYGWLDALLLTVGPLLFIYLRAFTGRPLKARWLWLHFLPVLGATLALGSEHLLPREVQLAGLLMDRQQPPTLDPILLLFGVHILGYLGACLVYLTRLSASLRQVTSNLDRISFLWLRRLLAIIIGVFLLYLPTIGPAHRWAPVALGFAFPLSLYLLAGCALLSPDVFSKHPAPAQPVLPDEPLDSAPATEPEVPSDDKYRKARLPEDLWQRYEGRVRAAMEGQKLFLDPDLSLALLAAQSGVSVHRLSQVLNERLGVRFCEYVNALRVEEAKVLLADPANQGSSILDLALLAGFSSKTTFNAVFKRSTGLTPTLWRTQAPERRAS